MAAPGAQMLTPRAPSSAGPRDDQVKCPSGSSCRIEYCALIMCGDTYAPTPIMCENAPPGAPTVLSAGPLLPALPTRITLCLCASMCAMSLKRPLHAPAGSP